MNILFVSNMRITPNSGGVQRVTQTLAKEFIAKDFNVNYLVMDAGENEAIEGVEQYYLPRGKNFNSEENNIFFKRLISHNNINIIINQTGFLIDEINFLRKNIEKNKIKIYTVHHNCLKCLNDQYNNIYINTLKEKKIDFLFANSVGWYFLRKLHKFRFKKQINQTLQKTDKLILLSKKFVNELNFYIKDINSPKVISIPNPNPFRSGEFNFPDKKNTLLFVGRLEFGQKRVDRLIKIWEHTYKKFPNWSLDIVGDGPLRSELERYVLINKIDRVNFYGIKKPEAFYKKGKILCMTSAFEGLPMVLIEAQNFGVVPISFNCFSSINEVIKNDYTGFIIEEFSIEVYIKKLHKLMEDDSRIEIMGQNAHQFVDKFNAESIAEKWINLFDK